jgi:hypothetical protein
MRMLFSIILIAIPCGFGSMPPQSVEQPRYPNELRGYEFFRTAKWRSLRPLISTIDEVRKTLGDPDEANDLSQYARQYPGDAGAKEAVWTYKVNRNWEILIYFASSCDRRLPKDVPRDRLCTIDLVPRRRISFGAVHFPPAFKKSHVTAVDAAWDEYSDGTGLRYEVYTTKTPYGADVPGDLNRISYGPLESTPPVDDPLTR